MFKFTWLLCFFSMTFGHVTTAASSSRWASSLDFTSFTQPTTDVAFAMTSLIIRGEGSFQWIHQNEDGFKELIISIVFRHMNNSEEMNFIPEVADIEIYAVDSAADETGAAFLIHYPRLSPNTFFPSHLIANAILGHSDHFNKVNFTLMTATFGPIFLPVENALANAWNERYWPSYSQSTATNTVEHGTFSTIHPTITTESKTTTEHPPTTPTPNLNAQTIWESIPMVWITSVTAFSLFLIVLVLIYRIISLCKLKMNPNATDIQMIRFDLNKQDEPAK